MDPTREKEMLYPPGARRATITPSAAKAVSAENTLAPVMQTEATSQANDPLAEIWTTIFQNDGRVAQGFQILHERVLAIEKMLGLAPTAGESGAAEGPAPEPPALATSPVRLDPTPTPNLPPVAEPVVAAPQQVPPAAAVPQPVQPVIDVRPASVSGGANELAAIVFPPDLARQPELAQHRQSLLNGLRHDDPATVGLVGELLIFRSSTIDKMPQVVKDVGEAWYRWRSDRTGGPDPFRDAIIDWLHRRMEQAGLTHRIALVHVGDRFDSKRHNTQGRGVEVTEVFGWLVLRDNGSVYTKASVAVA